jgi:hypothetical protein
MPVPNVERVRPPRVADERTQLDAFLDAHRATLLLKCQGLTDDELKRRSTPPSTLSLLGLVRHLTEVERSWFRRRVGGDASAAPLYYTAERPDADFDDTDLGDPADMFATYLAELDLCRASVQDVPLDAVFGEYSLRWVYLHMLEEYARHNGHADLLREAIDGAKGE